MFCDLRTRWSDCEFGDGDFRRLQIRGPEGIATLDPCRGSVVVGSLSLKVSRIDISSGLTPFPAVWLVVGQAGISRKHQMRSLH